MKVLLTNSIGKNKWGGGEKWMILAANGLIAKGHEVVIGCFPGSILEKNAKKNNVPTRVVNIRSELSVLGALQLRRIINSFQPDVLIGMQNKDVRIAGIVTTFGYKPLIIGRQGVKLIQRRWKHKYTFQKFCDGIITNTATIKQDYDNYGWWDDTFVKVIHNGVELEKYTGENFDFASFIPIVTPATKIILSAGRLSLQKGFKYLIQSAADICKSHPETYFFIAGKGKLKGELQRQINQLNLQNHVFLIGFKDNLKPLLSGCDLFVLPSLYEGMPNVVMEALANEVPTICTRVNGAEELFGGHQECLIPPADQHAISSAILHYLNNPAPVSIDIHTRIRELFSVDVMIANLLTYLNEKIEARIKSLALNKILIIQTAYLGDVILATPVIEKLKTVYPEAQIDVLVRKGNEQLLDNNPNLSHVIIFNKNQKKYQHLIKLIKSIRKTRYDLVVNMQRFATTGLITAFSKGKKTVGFDKNPLSFLFTKSVSHKMHLEEPSIHEVERNISLIEDLTDSSLVRPKMYPSGADREKIKTPLVYYCIAPTSVLFTKEYPHERWAQLIAHLSKEVKVYILGAPSDWIKCEAIMALSGAQNVENLAGKLTFLESAALMEKAKMNFVNDSAPLHIASAMNAPVRAIFCSTIPALGYTPLSDDSMVIETDEKLPCRPCGITGKKACPEGHFACANIPIEKILKTF